MWRLGTRDPACRGWVSWGALCPAAARLGVPEVLTIRRTQFVAFREQLTTAFLHRMVRHLGLHFPRQLSERDLGAVDLEPLVRQGMEQAEQYGVVYEDAVRRYLECMVILGPRFDEDRAYPWAGETLRRDDLDGEQKMNTIGEHIVFEVPHLAEP